MEELVIVGGERDGRRERGGEARERDGREKARGHGEGEGREDTLHVLHSVMVRGMGARELKELTVAPCILIRLLKLRPKLCLKISQLSPLPSHLLLPTPSLSSSTS